MPANSPYTGRGHYHLIKQPQPAPHRPRGGTTITTIKPPKPDNQILGHTNTLTDATNSSTTRQHDSGQVNNNHET